MTAQVSEAPVYDHRVSIAPEAAWLKEMRGELQRLVGAKVKDLRQAVGLSQAQLGERVAKVVAELEPGRPAIFWAQQTAISRIEGGRISITLELIEILARALDVDPLVLVEPAFTRLPRDPEAIAEARLRILDEKLDELLDHVLDRYKSVIEDDRFGRAMSALVELAGADEKDFDVAVSMLEGLVSRRAEQAAEAENYPGITADLGLAAVALMQSAAARRRRQPKESS